MDFYYILKALVNCWFFIVSFVALVNFVKDVKNLDFYFYSVLHKRSSISFYRYGGGENPSILDMLFDLKYIFKKRRFIFIVYAVTFICGITTLWFIPLIYMTCFSISLATLSSYLLIVFFSFTPKERVVEPLNLKKVQSFNAIDFLRYFLVISPYNWAFLSLYLLRSLGGGKFKAIGGQFIISSLVLKLPFWFVVQIFGLAVDLVDYLNTILKSSARLSIKGYKSDVRYRLHKKFYRWVISGSMKLNFLLSGKKIYVKGFSIRINGGCGSKSVAKSFVEYLPKDKMLFTKGYVVWLNGRAHQSFKMDESSNLFCILTSRPEIDVKSEVYKCANAQRPESKQYLAFSHVDLDQTRYEEGFLSNVVASSALYSFDTYCGYVIKLNLVYKFYATKKLLLQSESSKTLLSFEKFLTYAQMHVEPILKEGDDLERVIKKIGVLSLKDEGLNSAFDDVLCSSNSEVFENWKKAGFDIPVYADLRETYDTLKPLDVD